MNWFEGPIENAILKCKNDQLIFMVYVFDPNAREMDDLWNKEEIYSVCCKECVALRIDSTTETFKQFSAIYKVLCLPTTYFISDNGMPLEIIAGVVDFDGLSAKLNKVVESFNVTKKPKQEGNVAQAASNVVNAEANNAASNIPPVTEEVKKEKSLEEKVAEAKEKIRQLQQEKEEKEKEKERKEEIERRKLGQEMLRNKQLKEEQEMKRLAEERRKEKLNEELAKKRVLEQIQRDREEKQKKYEKEKQEIEEAELKKKQEVEQEKQRLAALEESRKSTHARIQFRLTDGLNIVERFDSEEKLEKIRQFLIEKLSERNYPSSFTMHTMHPKRIFTDNDMNSSLKELGLAPSSTILVISSQNKTISQIKSALPVQSNGVFNILSTLASFFLIPITFIWNMISNLFTTQPPANRRTNQASSSSSSQEAFITPTPVEDSPSRPSAATAAAANTREPTASDIRLNRSRLLGSFENKENTENLRKREPFKKEGNIARLKDDDDKDSDTNTWNGNSTQQM